MAAVRRNGPLKIAIAEMKAGYMTHGQALIHSDLHTGSIMANGAATKVIDPEFAFYGPMGFDVGAVLENLVLNHLSHFAHTPDPDARAEYQDYLLGLVRDIWTQFAAKFDALWRDNNRGELAPHGLLELPRRRCRLRPLPRRLHPEHSARRGRLRRLQDAAPHDGHRQRLGHLQHRGSGPTRRGRAPGHPHRQPLGAGAPPSQQHRRPHCHCPLKRQRNKI
ncbi:MAG: phosphotransferase [Caldilineaceae bacterium]